MPRPDSVPLVIERFKPRVVKAVYEKYRVWTCGRGKGGWIQMEGPKLGTFMLAAARKFARHLNDACDFLDGGAQVITADSKCRCGSKKGLKMVQDRLGHWRAQLRWGPPMPVCPQCCKKDRGTFRYCPVK